MLYKPTSPSPYAQCVALDGTEDSIVNFSCSMMGGSEIETVRLKISDRDAQYYFDATTSIVAYVRKATTRIYSNNGNYCLGGSSVSYPGITYIYPVYAGLTYFIECHNNPIFRVFYHTTYYARGTRYPLTMIYDDGVLNEYEYTAENDGYIYINVSRSDSSSVNNNIIISVAGGVSADGKIVPNIGRQNGVTDIAFSSNTNSEYGGYTISLEGSERSSFVGTLLSKILVPDKDYTWQTRLYEKDSLTNDAHRSNIWLGYGVVETLGYDSESSNTRNGNNYFYVSGQSYDNSTPDDDSRICFKVRPHTNIHFPNATGGETSVSNFDLKHLFNYYDDNARYYIKVNGKYYSIRDYRFYSPVNGENSESSSWLASTFEKSFDNYGEPLYGYVVVDYDSDADEPILKSGDQYEIFCNYIDSDEFYFNVVDKPSLTFTGTLGESISETKDSPTSLAYSNLVLTGEYNHATGAIIEKYNVVLYCGDTIIDQTDDIFDSSITYKYDMLMNGNDYKIVVATEDSLGYKSESVLYATVSYTDTTADTTESLDVRFYPRHDSVVIDWNDCDLGDVSYYDVYKKIGNGSKLHKVYSTKNANERVIEDFAVGNLCDYTYYVYPVATSAFIEPTATYTDTLYEYVFDSNESEDYLCAYSGCQTQRFEVVGGETYYITGCNIGQLNEKNFPFIVCFNSGNGVECVHGYYSDGNYSTSSILTITDNVEYNNLKIEIPENISVIYVNSTGDVEISVRQVTSDGDTPQLQSPITGSINFNYGATTLLGLVQDEEDLNTYTIDYNEVWRFEFNVKNTGTTLSMDKTFVDSQNRFPKMMGGNRKYNTIPVEGLIGYYDCEKDDYVDNYDLLEDWESFATNNRLKLLKDRRGRLAPCDIETSSFEYMDVLEAPATVSFSAKQLKSLDNITILGRALSYNPVRYNLLTTSNGEVLVEKDGEVLTSQEE